MAMVKRVVFATLVAMSAGTVQAEHAVAPEGVMVPAVTREVCTTASGASTKSAPIAGSRCKPHRKQTRP